MPGYIGALNDDLHDTISVVAKNEIESKAGEMPAVIVSFNVSNQTAVVRPLFSYKKGDQVFNVPDLLDVPVRFPRLGGARLTFPVSSGDFVTLRPMVRSMEGYHAGGDAGGDDARYNSLSDMEAHIDGSHRTSNPIESFDNENVSLSHGDYYIKISESGKIRINTASGSLLNILEKTLEYLVEQNIDSPYEIKYQEQLDRLLAVKL